MRPNPAIATLHQLLRYEPDTGKLFWRERNRNLTGLEAGGVASPDGYRRIRINGQTRLAHRIILAMDVGVWPVNQVDHINGNRSDNRLENLRAVTLAENLRNKAQYRSNTSGCTGVYWCKVTQKWCASIQRDGRRVNLGRFLDLAYATAVRRSHEPDFDFHPNHGRLSA